MHFNFKFLKYFSSGDIQTVDDVSRNENNFFVDIGNIKEIIERDTK